jgi:tellurite resistance protein TerC
LQPLLFPLAEYWWAYAAFTGFIVLLLALDLGVFNKNPHAVSIREATIWSAVWIAVALVFNWFLWAYAAMRFPADIARQVALEFAAGYVVERALSFDNIFVFVVVFRYFAIPARFQHRVLFFGIVGAFVFRGIFIALGSLLIQFHWVVVGFGVLLIFTGIRMAAGNDETIEPEKNPVVRLLRRTLPVATNVNEPHFLVRIGGVLHATPLLIALVFLELTDVVFAVDSVPAVFALTREPFLVFTSNIFAILGLRAMYFMLAGAMDRFYLLKYGLSAVLVFVGLKMTVFDGRWLPHIPLGWSLGVICIVLVLAIAGSLAFPRPVDAKS